MRNGAGRIGEKGEGIQKHELLATKTVGGCKAQREEQSHSVWCRVGHRLVGAGGGHFVSYMRVSPLCCTPEAKIILYVNCHLKIKKKTQNHFEKWKHS